MSKIDKFEACDRFMKNVVSFILPIEQRRFVLVDHSVSDDEFVIKINYDKSQFEHRINESVWNIIREGQNSDLSCTIGRFIGCCVRKLKNLKVILEILLSLLLQLFKKNIFGCCC